MKKKKPEIKTGGDSTVNIQSINPPKVKRYRLLWFTSDWQYSKSAGVKWYQYIWGYDVWAGEIPLIKTWLTIELLIHFM